MKTGGCFREKEMAVHTGASTGEHCRMQGAERGVGRERGRCRASGQPVMAPCAPNKDLCLNLSLRALFTVCLSGEGWRVGGGGAWGRGSGGGQMKTSVRNNSRNQ